jgi:general secretion pathway protein D
LGDIPILGELFKYRDNDDSKTELIIFVTPRIINDNRLLKDDHLIKTNVDNKNNKHDTKVNSTEPEKSKQEIINKYLEESSKERKELLNSIRKDKKEKEFEDLTPEELEAILAN